MIPYLVFTEGKSIIFGYYHMDICGIPTDLKLIRARIVAWIDITLEECTILRAFKESTNIVATRPFEYMIVKPQLIIKVPEDLVGRFEKEYVK
jgi:hypothetical protein